MFEIFQMSRDKIKEFIDNKVVAVCNRCHKPVKYKVISAGDNFKCYVDICRNCVSMK